MLPRRAAQAETLEASVDSSIPVQAQTHAVAVVARPKAVSLAVALLWISWTLSCIGVVLNYFLFPSAYLNLATVVAVVLLALQVVVIYYVGKGSNAARWLAVVVLFLALPALAILGKLIADRSLLSAGITATQFLLKVVAIAMLFTRASSTWFRQVAARRAGL
jgi:hypothetical protein